MTYRATNYKEAHQYALLHEENSNLARCYLTLEEREKRIKVLVEIAKEHQKRYNEMTEQEYWKGRRDEAGWLADELLKIIEVR